MRNTMIATILITSLPACGDSVAESRSSAASASGSTGAGTGTGGGGAGGSASGPREGMAEPSSPSPGLPLPLSFCSFEMTGAMNVSVTESDGVQFWTGYFSCTGKIGSDPWSFSASPEEPGYWELDGADGGTLVEFEAPGSAPCVFTYSIPPPTSPCLTGVPVAGTFSCGQLVDEDDSTQVVSIAEGRFATLVSGSGDCD